jgi:hypothetical protein
MVRSQLAVKINYECRNNVQRERLFRERIFDYACQARRPYCVARLRLGPIETRTPGRR